MYLASSIRGKFAGIIPYLSKGACSNWIVRFRLTIEAFRLECRAYPSKIYLTDSTVVLIRYAQIDAPVRSWGVSEAGDGSQGLGIYCSSEKSKARTLGGA